MSVLRYLVPALAVAGHAAAATCTVSATTTISSAADATGLATCQTFSGSIAIASGTTDSIALDGIEKITGDLIANGTAGMSALSGDSLSSIGGTFGLDGLIHLTSLSFPMLTSANTVVWNNLPALQGLSFTSGLQMIQDLTITDTQLTSLTGIDLEMADQIIITNNKYLTDITMQLGNVTTNVQINSNSDGLKIAFPNLIWAGMLQIGDSQSVSIPSLSSVNNTLGFYTNSFQSLVAPNLTTVGGTLAVDDNNSLTNASFPELKTLGGGFQIQNNTNLLNINGFPALQRVAGAVDVYGTFTNITLPALNYVRGGFDVESSGDITSSCNTFAPLFASGGAVQGTHNCKALDAAAASATASSPGGAAPTGGAAATHSPSGAAHPMQIPGATGLLGVVAVIFGML